MGLAVVTIASGGLPIVETTRGIPVSEAASGFGVPVTKVTGKPGLPVTFETIGIVAPVTYATLNGVATTTTLSNGNLTATRSNTSTTMAGARSASLKNTGKYYVEVTVGIRNGRFDSISLMPAANTYADNLSAGTSIFMDVSWFAVQNVYTNGTGGAVKVIPTTVGSVIGVAADMDNRRAWFRSGAGLWNNTAGANPATNVGGQQIVPVTAHALMLCFGDNASTVGDTYTVNFGATAFANTAPAGFTGWPV
jgi:hypothetical protein